MKTVLLLGSTALSLVLAVTAQAADTVRLGDVNYAGSGCSGTSAGVRTHFNARTGRLQIFMPDMQVDTLDRTLDRRSCNIAIPVELPPGKTLVLSQHSIFGEVDLPGTVRLRINSEMFFTGGRGPTIEIDRVGDTVGSENFYVRGAETVTSACGPDAILRVNTGLTLNKTQTRDAGSAVIDGIALTLKVQDCP